MKFKFNSLMLVAVLCCSFVYAEFDDNFTRSDSNTVGNGWVETESSTSQLDIQIVNNEVSWVRIGSTDTNSDGSIEHTFDAASEISIQMKMPVIGSDGPSMIFTIYDDDSNKIGVLLAEKYGTDGQVVRIYVNGVEAATRNVDDYDTYNTYKFVISDSGQVSVLFNNSTEWESPHGTLGYATKANVKFSRWWRWNQAFADTFNTTDAPDACQCDPNLIDIERISEIALNDEFSRSDNSDVGNGWTETSAGNAGGGGSLPSAEISGREVLFKRNGWGSNAYAKISRSFAVSQNIDNASVDLALDTNASSGSNVTYTDFKVTGTNRDVSARVFVDTNDSSKLGVGLYDEGTWSWGQTSNNGSFNNLRFTNEIINGQQETCFYFNDSLLWTSDDGGLGVITDAEVSANWKVWVDTAQQYADNFVCSKTISSDIDVFDRPDSTTVGNSWTQTYAGNAGGGGSNPSSEIYGNEIVFKRNGWGSNAYAMISKSFDSTQNIDNVSIDLALGTDASQGSNVTYTELKLTGTERNVNARVFVDTNDDTKLGVGLYDEGTWTWGQTSNNGSYNNLRFTNEMVSGQQQTRFYFNDTLLWTSDDGGVGMITDAEISANWKIWVDTTQQYADNFIADSSCLFDEDDSTYLYPGENEYLISKDSSELIMIEMFIDAAAEGSVWVDCGDVMPRVINYELGKTWYRLRIPYSTSRNIIVSWDDPNDNAKWCDIRVASRTAVPNSFTATDTVNISLDITGEGSTAVSEVPFGVMCNWWENGLVDAILDSSVSQELISLFADYGVDGLRYPGGTGTYGYPLSSDAIQPYIDAGLTDYAYGLYADPIVWASAEDYLDFCIAAGITSWYEINPGYWFDSVNDDVYKSIPMKTDDPNMTTYLTQAVSAAVDFADTLHTSGADVIWEIGNEDYCYYSGDDYAVLCEAFVEGIKYEYPNDKFAVCGDSNSWSDWTFHNDLVDALEVSNISDVEYSSNHLYLTGVGYWDSTGYHAYPWNTARDICNSTIAAWPQIKAQYINPVTNFNNAGFNTKSAITEFNVIGPGRALDERVEHSFGRAIGEAQTVCSIFNELGSCFFVHDLVRKDPNSTWFARLDYYPANESGQKYYPFAEFVADSMATNHGHGNIVYSNTTTGVCVSKHSDYLYITAVNKSDEYRGITLDVDGVSYDTSKATDMHQLISDDPDCFYFNYFEYEYTQPAPTSGDVYIEAYPYSITAAKVYIQ
ncbi:MAG: hypothetical protein ACIAQZ_15895 [Sedimentisphaeraceae bacterium JB056]